MAKKRKPAKEVAQHKCHICEGPMSLKAVIPAATTFPEMRTFQCTRCGYLRTVEDDTELTSPPWIKVGLPSQSGASG